MSQVHLPSDLFLAIDQGGQSTRVAIYSSTGKQICCYSAACATTHRRPAQSSYEYIEQNGEEILTGIRDCLQKIQQHLGDDVTKIQAASFAGQGSSLLCWNNQTGAALTPVLSWQDIRGEPYLTNSPLTHQQTQELTGLRLSPHYGATKIRWCLEHDKNVVQAQQDNCLSIGPIVSYIFWHLLGKQSLVDPGHAQRTLLWNLQCNEWDQSLLDIFKIPRAVLPHCQYHNSHFGDLQLGNHTIPFSASARDQGASLFARGLPEPDSCYINIGTGAFIQRLSENLHAPEGLLVSPLWLPENPVDKKYYAWEATVNGAAAAISFIQQQTGLAITPQDIDSALALDPTADCYFLNAVGGLSAPYWRTDLQSRFSENLSAEEKILAWIESVIFQIVINVQLMNQLGSTKKIIISGGFSKADAVCQKIADLTNANIHRSDNADATVQGVACMAAGLPQSWKPVLQEDVFTPQQNPELLQRFTKWQSAMQQWIIP
ncbi:FGGY family carbohydrate kinase [Cellvibrio fibrivorans]|uniref:Glycerol kinase n=1 Tax=Cellvibrio fibrivorans TaxID=126350 RepID=A0ABU1UYK6_9GAMM|nr:FGGY family carbohydrate kinase [Cellvibrio fibrivorans]MDR7090285.1 glycerol kinase [Cellvibrio fibrivorans]